MAAWRRAIELSLGEADTAKLRSIAQSRTEPASRVERARILLAYREDPSFFAVGRALGLHHQTVQRCHGGLPSPAVVRVIGEPPHHRRPHRRPAQARVPSSNGTDARVKQKMAPPLGLGRIRSSPPFASTIDRQMERPSPMPWRLVEMNGSNR